MACNTRWTIRPSARNDLAGIWQEGASTWGAAQADRYADSLFALFHLLVEFPDIAPERAEFAPPVRMHPIGAHLVIYRAQGEGIEIIRVLHARQELTAFLFDG